MGKKRSNGPSPVAMAKNQALSLREESSGKTRGDTPSTLRVQHLQRLAAWAGREAGMGPIGALLGRRLASNAEAAGIPLGTSTFLCQRCETVLQPGFNCTIRIKNNKKKIRRRKKSNSCQNSIAFSCHFCGDQNLIWGNAKGIVTNLLSSRKPTSMDSTSVMLEASGMHMKTITLKERHEHSQATVSQVESSSRLKPSKDEHGKKPKLNVSELSKVLVISPRAEHGQIAAGTDEEDITQKIVVESTNENGVHETESLSCGRINTCQSDDTLQTEFPIGSTFVTPQKNKLPYVTLNDSTAASNMKSTRNMKGECYVSITDKIPANSSEPASVASAKDTKSAPSGTALVAGNSRKRARKGWTTLKQIAEKDEFERKEKMGNFVIPFFMQ